MSLPRSSFEHSLFPYCEWCLRRIIPCLSTLFSLLLLLLLLSLFSLSSSLLLLLLLLLLHSQPALLIVSRFHPASRLFFRLVGG